MDVLVMGATGMLGMAFMRSSSADINMIGAGRDDLEFTNQRALFDFLDAQQPDVVVNAAANIRLLDCEENPGKTSLINVDFVGNLAAWCARSGAYLFHVSSDHFYNYGGSSPHTELDEVVIVNEYARQKLAAEKAALTCENSFVARTSILGYRGAGAPTLIEWILSTIKRESLITGFVDAYTSSLDVNSFVDVALLCIKRRLLGIYNVASTDVFSKYDLINEILTTLNDVDTVLAECSVQNLHPERASCCGLNVNKIQAELGINLPGLRDVVEGLCVEENYNAL